MKQRSTIFLVVMLVISSLIFLYPSISNHWNDLHQTSAIATYEQTMQDIGQDKYADVLADAQAYNQNLASLPKVKYENGQPVDAQYASLLNINDSNIMGYITIDKIDVKLPIYHGTSESVLSIGTGHLEGSSLPIGGASTHAVITGHRGLASATLFTHLDEIEKGDIFTLSVLSQTLTYQVDQVLIVPPEDTDPLSIVQGKDYCTLVTCTPFGVNTDRILVRGTRIENIEAIEVRVTSEAKLIDPVIVAGCIIAPAVFVFMLLIFFAPASSKKD